MADFTPEHYLAAARIAYPLKGGLKWILYFGQLHTKSKSGITREFFNPHESGNDYRALREALDKEYEIHIKWSQSEQNWFSLPSLKHMAERLIDPMSDDDITRLMMKNVVALVEAGVVE